MTVYDTLKEMRVLSENNIPFSISYISYNESKNKSNGVRYVDKCILRKGYNRDKSSKANILIGYVDLKDNSNKWFYLPLLLKNNKIDII